MLLHLVGASSHDITIHTGVTNLKIPETKLQFVQKMFDVLYSLFCKVLTQVLHALPTIALSVAILYCIPFSFRDLVFLLPSFSALPENFCLCLHLLPLCLKFPWGRQEKWCHLFDIHVTVLDQRKNTSVINSWTSHYIDFTCSIM